MDMMDRMMDSVMMDPFGMMGGPQRHFSMLEDGRRRSSSVRFFEL